MADNDGVAIERIFDAPCELVWKAWTDEELAKKWWGPEGFTAPSIKIDLRVGGKYVFCMRGPKGSEWDKNMYSAGEYLEIVDGKKLVVTDYFSDENGNKVEPGQYGMKGEFPSVQTVTVTFEEVEEGKTKLTINYPKPESEEQFQAMLASGMKEGWASSLVKLEETLK